jgi:hypothetical protein
MKNFFMAINPIDLTTIAEDEIVEALAEFGCTQIVIDGHYYATCKTYETLARMLFTVDLPGSIVHVTDVFDSKEVTTESFVA